MFTCARNGDHPAWPSDIAAWRHDTLLIFLAALVAAWLLGWVFHVGTGIFHALLLVTAVFSVVRLPWRRPR
jgi:hypothetical protein